jgi:shikimate 5-dehydrogenase
LEKKLDIIIGTIPADKTIVEDFPEELFGNKRGVCVDMTYKPRDTPLLKAAARNQGWKIIMGVDVLPE